MLMSITSLLSQIKIGSIGPFSLFILLFLSTQVTVEAQSSTKLEMLFKKHIPGVKVKQLDPLAPFQSIWELKVPQALDHNHPEKGSFYQKIYVHHAGFSRPVVFVTEGYDGRSRVYEPTTLLDANQVTVEYRYFGDSKPEKMDWTLLNHDQALKDLHYINGLLKKMYKKRWISTGISKGGTTTALYKLSYPKDIKASVAYVAPFPTAQEDHRTIDHYKKQVGTEECRKRIFEFQKSILQNREELRPLIENLAHEEKVNFSIGVDKVIDFASVEFPFSFWQWGFDCSELPLEPWTPKVIFDFIEEVVDFNFYDDPTCKSFEPAYYQFMTEFGYYGFDTTGLNDLLLYENELSNLAFCPKNADLTYRGAYMKKMKELAENKGKNIIYIYGGRDTWTACGIFPRGKSYRFDQKFGGHRTRIKNLDTTDKLKIYSLLSAYTKTKIQIPE